MTPSWHHTCKPQGRVHKKRTRRAPCIRRAEEEKLEQAVSALRAASKRLRALAQREKHFSEVQATPQFMAVKVKPLTEEVRAPGWRWSTPVPCARGARPAWCTRTDKHTDTHSHTRRALRHRTSNSWLRSTWARPLRCGPATLRMTSSTRVSVSQCGSAEAAAYPQVVRAPLLYQLCARGVRPLAPTCACAPRPPLCCAAFANPAAAGDEDDEGSSQHASPEQRGTASQATERSRQQVVEQQALAKHMQESRTPQQLSRHASLQERLSGAGASGEGKAALVQSLEQRLSKSGTQE